MPGAGGKSTAGFTKQAQKQKYVRNRDVKLKERELKNESRIQQNMGDGVCPKCREKLQWRFQFNKYKALKNLANCQGCKKKCITKAYRTLCDNCASERRVCPGCCKNMHEALEAKKQRDAAVGALKGSDSMEVDEESARDDNCDNDDNVDMEEEIIQTGSKRPYDESEVVAQSNSDWNAKKFEDFAASKYSKTRVVGSEGDLMFSFSSQPRDDINERSSDMNTDYPLTET
mmetsp:Transcript_3876/g.6059  ORF Transcript_3876/g.6059 Transcript_3876/m.6059 type:complete len:230 (+) Transcript_3876:81-770(+)